MRYWRSLRVFATGTLAAVILAAFAAISPMSGAGTHDESAEPAATRAMQCESGIEVAADGTETSSAVVESVPADTQLPAGCHWVD